MKTKTCSTILLFAISVVSGQTLVLDDFEGLTPGALVAVELSNWAGFGGDDNISGMISTDQAFSGAQSLKITTGDDTVPFWTPLTAGDWVLSAQLYVSSGMPSAGTSTFALAGGWNGTGTFGGFTTAIQLQFAQDLVIGGGGSATLVRDAWKQIKIQYSQSQGTADLFYDGAYLGTVDRSQLGAVNIFGSAEVNGDIYYDDFTLELSPVRLIESDESTDVEEGGRTDTIEVVLSQMPSDNVTVNLAVVGNIGEISLSTSSLVFTSGSWNDAQIVTVEAIDDALEEGDELAQVRMTLSSTDAAFNGKVIDATVNIAASDLPAIKPQGFLRDTFDLTHDYLDGNVKGTIWDGVFEGVDDDNGFVSAAIANGDTAPGRLLLHTVSGHMNHQGTDGAFIYKLVEGDFVATVQVPEIEPVGFNESGIMARVPELAQAGTGGNDEDFVQPRRRGWGGGSTQMRNLNNGARTDSGTGPDVEWIRLERVGDDFIMSNSADGVNWAINTTTTRTDLNGLALQVGLFQASYNGGGLAAQLDNFTLRTADVLPLLVYETGETTDTFEVVMSDPLSREATYVASVTDPNSLKLVGADPDGTLQLTFDQNNWDQPKTVTVQAVDEGQVNEAVREVLVLIDPADPNAIDPNSVIWPQYYVADVVDNDAPGIAIVGATPQAVEGNGSDTYNVILTVAPTGDVVITPSDSSDPNQVTLTTSITFTPGDWAPKSVSVSAIDDVDVEGDPHVTVITHAVSAVGTNYESVTVPDKTVHIADNECGSWGFLSLDTNQDCVFNLVEWTTLVAGWLDCSVPNDLSCVDLR